MTASAIRRHALFDFGGPVLMTPFELSDAAECQLGLAPGSLPRGPFDVDGDPQWKQLQAGEITERQYWHDRAAAVGLSVPDYMSHFYVPGGDHLVRPRSWQVVRDVRAAGFQAGVLTNALTAFHGAEWGAAITVLSEISPLIDLSAHGHLKPHPLAYQTAIEVMGVAADEMVFLDDQPVNIAGADEAGIPTVWFDVTDVDDSIRRFREALTRA